MLRFGAGLLVGALLGAGGAWLALRRGEGGAPAVASASTPDAGAPSGKDKKKGRRRAGRPPGGAAGEPGDEPIPEISGDDLRIVSEGDSLAVAPRRIDMSEAAEQPRDLTQDEIDAGVSARAPAIIRCIEESRGPAPVSGSITVKFVVSASGAVTQTRIAAPAYLMRRGLYACVRPELRKMRFPPTGKDSVLTVPFDLS